MNFRDLASEKGEGQQGLAYESDDRRWRVTRKHMGPDAEWCVWQALAGGWVRRASWAALATEQEAGAVAAVLASLPFGASLGHARATVGWYARRAITGVAARFLAALGPRSGPAAVEADGGARSEGG